MTLLYRIRAFLRWRFRRHEIEQALDDDVEDYVERSAAEKIRAGMSEAEARRAARIELGGIEQTKERVRAKLTFDPIDVTSRDVRHALRSMRRQKTFTAMAVLCLALGIAAPTALFSAFHAVLLDALPVPEPERLVNVTAPGPKIGQMTWLDWPGEWVFSYPTFRELESRQTALAGLAAHARFEANIASDGESIAATGMLVSGSYFSVLRLQPALGRLITPADEPRIGDSPVAVLSHAYWQRHLDADPNVVGRTVIVSGYPLTVIGVAPAGFRGTMLDVEPAVFVPLTMRWQIGLRTSGLEGTDYESRDYADPFSYWLYLFGRLHPGGTLDAASSELDALFSVVRGAEYLPEGVVTDANRDQHSQRRIVLEPGARGQNRESRESGPVAQVLNVLLGLSLLVLLVVCMNIANLMLARGASRKGEMAVRASIGASRGRLVRQLLTEAGVLAAVGGLLSLPIASLLLNALQRIMPFEWFGLLGLTLSVPALAFAAGTTVATVLVFALVPALAGTRTDPVAVVKGHSTQSVGSRHAMRFRRGLAIVQIACSLAFLAMAGLLTASLVNVARVDLGMDADSVVAFDVSPSHSGYGVDETSRLYDRIEDALAAEPGVTSVSSSTLRLFDLGQGQQQSAIAVEGFTPSEDFGFADAAGVQWVSPRFFETLSIPLLLGRDFTDADRAGAPLVAIVSESFVEKYELGPNPIGRRVGAGGGPLDTEIVGVVADAKYASITQSTPAQLFRPHRQVGRVSAFDSEVKTFYVRAGLAPEVLMRAIRRVVARLDPSLPVSSLTTVREAAREEVALRRSFALMAGGAAALTTLLAALGLYGVLAYSVRERTRELGLRLALGASPSGLRRMVLRQLAAMTSVGAVIGVAAALGAGKVVEALLFGVSSFDPRVLVGAVLVLAVAVSAAGYLPAARAARVAPMEALRYE